MATLFPQINSALVQEFVGYVRTIKAAYGDDFANYSDLGVSVNTGKKGAGQQYAPSEFISALTDDNSIKEGDKVVIKGLLSSRTSDKNDKTYYSLDRYTLFPVIVLEKAKPRDGATTNTKTTTKSAAPVADDDDEDF